MRLLWWVNDGGPTNERRRGTSRTATGHQLGASGGAAIWEALLFRRRQESMARTAGRRCGSHKRVVKKPDLAPNDLCATFSSFSLH
ncbi:hypothetical protein C2845_PM01G02240 [Panicum miliaceum]|uniref:Uncharacterized protein n=1 Tax=Panicum miliaceum TaxID=4540 RepID=A0A3L6TUI0_PANMI|nr:hypothetical protein C2845_PM01G02240 [Panicum miliaceum]